MDDLDQHARALRALPPSCGPVRLLAVDGHAGSGKSTFAARLAAAVGNGVPVLHLDDLASHAEPFAWTDRMLSEVIAPLARGSTAHYHPYDWNLRRFTSVRALEAAPVVLIEGVGAGRRVLRPYLAWLLWMEREAEESWQRGRRRDGSELSTFWDGWTVAETRHFAADPSRPFANALVRERQEGYEWLPGPPATARPNQLITQSDRFPPAS
ncbi:uridine kinase family protein [Streptomyces sp. CA-135486]|uniref:uridine kinase family protein n=1 Tax=Streptomyces sp. CA-135486 TaxID=3240049 RepID=UPI003D90ADF8